MPRNKFVNHKGRHRTFTNPEELEQQRRKDEEAKKWQRRPEDEENAEEEEEEEEEEGKAKGVSNLIQIENPNRVAHKPRKLTSATNPDELVAPAEEAQQLSRREREEIARQRARADYQRLHAAGKTEEARADLARLAIVKQQREEAQRRRENERKLREDAAKSKAELTHKALGKK